MTAIPILLFSDECSVCLRIGHWVQKCAASAPSKISARPIGNDPLALRALDANLDIWAAYATIHVVMPDGTMKLGGEAVAEVLRDLPNTRWFAWTFRVGLLGFYPFQLLLNLAYAILSDVRPLLGCSGCGAPAIWVKPILEIVKGWKRLRGQRPATPPTAHFTAVSKSKGLAPKSDK